MHDLLAGQCRWTGRRRRSAVVRPLRPVTMNASFGPATLIRESTKITRTRTSSDRAADGDEEGHAWGPVFEGRESVGLLDDARWSR